MVVTGFGSFLEQKASILTGWGARGAKHTGRLGNQRLAGMIAPAWQTWLWPPPQSPAACTAPTLQSR